GVRDAVRDYQPSTRWLVDAPAPGLLAGGRGARPVVGTGRQRYARTMPQNAESGCRLGCCRSPRITCDLTHPIDDSKCIPTPAGLYSSVLARPPGRALRLDPAATTPWPAPPAPWTGAREGQVPERRRVARSSRRRRYPFALGRRRPPELTAVGGGRPGSAGSP